MELPKNITQIGEADPTCKIYVEDYVVSYMKQLNQVARDKELAIALYGKQKREKEVSYLFVYGACKLDFLQKETRRLSQAQSQEIERLRKKYFPENTFLGYRLLNGEMVEGFHICEQEICRYIKGYAQFYEKNDSMLAYMLEVRENEAAPEVVEQEKYEMVKRRQEERKTQYEGGRKWHMESGFGESAEGKKAGEEGKEKPVAEEKEEEDTEAFLYHKNKKASHKQQAQVLDKKEMSSGKTRPTAAKKTGASHYAPRRAKQPASGTLKGMRVATVAAFALLCVAGVETAGQGKGLEEIKETAGQVISNLTEQKLPDSLEAGSEKVVAGSRTGDNVQSSTLATEDKLTEILYAENAATASSSNGQAIHTGEELQQGAISSAAQRQPGEAELPAIAAQTEGEAFAAVTQSGEATSTGTSAAVAQMGEETSTGTPTQTGGASSTGTSAQTEGAGASATVTQTEETSTAAPAQTGGASSTGTFAQTGGAGASATVTQTEETSTDVPAQTGEASSTGTSAQTGGAGASATVTQTEETATAAPAQTGEASSTGTSAQTGERQYVIKKGDTLTGISMRNYGTDAKVSDICSLNQITNPDNIKIGQKILLP